METAGKDGGFILTDGCGIDHAKAENDRAMMEAGLEYGILRWLDQAKTLTTRRTL